MKIPTTMATNGPKMLRIENGASFSANDLSEDMCSLHPIRASFAVSLLSIRDRAMLSGSSVTCMTCKGMPILRTIVRNTMMLTKYAVFVNTPKGLQDTALVTFSKLIQRSFPAEKQDGQRKTPLPRGLLRPV
ncbi:hypothetical protein HQN90_14235 [Paenibacillus alba]|nr:hypothetical protein [Paenibacillus alba]